MIRGRVRGVASAAALASGLICSLGINGCSSSNQHSATGSSASSTSANPPAPLKLTVSGKDQNIKGPVKCDITADGFIKIAIGEGIAGTDTTPYSATMTNMDPLDVRSVDIGEVDGEGLVYLKGFYNDTAKSKPFEMDVTCP